MPNKSTFSYAGRPTFFAAADVTVAELIGERGFDRSLVHNLLFGSRLVVDEPFFFNSSLLLKHVEGNRGRSFFEAAARAGLVSPAMRVSGERDLKRSLRRMRETYAHGFLPNELDERHRSIIRAVHEGLEKVDCTYPVEGLHAGSTYETAMATHFLTDAPPPGVSLEDWLAMQEWRALIPEACRETVARGQQGLQRAELVRSISRALHIAPDIGLLPLETLISQCGSPRREQSLRAFWLRMNQIHWVNSANAFSSSPNLPGYEVSANDRAAAPRGPGSHGSLFLHSVGLPSVDALLRVDPEKLLDARRIEGQAFFDVLADGFPSPEDIRKEFDTYARRLCQLASQSQWSMWGIAPPVRKALKTLAAIGTFTLAGSVFMDDKLSDNVESFIYLANAGTFFVSIGLAAEAKRRVRPRRTRLELTLDQQSTNAAEDDAGAMSKNDGSRQ